jgi:hypothetical protein
MEAECLHRFQKQSVRTFYIVERKIEYLPASKEKPVTGCSMTAPGTRNGTPRFLPEVNLRVFA